jgi:predicted tellurium resistance membrane protein TerC
LTGWLCPARTRQLPGALPQLETPARLASRSLFTISDSYDGNKFFTEKDGVRMATPLLLVLLIVELSDIVFAVDSIPAVRGDAHLGH